MVANCMCLMSCACVSQSEMCTEFLVVTMVYCDMGDKGKINVIVIVLAKESFNMFL